MSRYLAEEEARRGVSLSLTNPVFAKLIKMGRELGRTPQRMAQELFEEAYAARCMGKPKLAAGDEAAELRKLYDLVNSRAVDLKAKLDDAEQERADLWRKNRELDGDRDVANAAAEELRGKLATAEEGRVAAWEHASSRTKRIEQLEATIGRLRAENSELTVKVEELHKKVTTPPAEVLTITPADMPTWAQAPSSAQLRSIKAMASARNSPAAIARQLNVSIEMVKAALA